MTPTSFGLLNHTLPKAVTEADMAFVRDAQFRKWVEIYAKDEERFFADFARAFTKLEELGCSTLQRKKFLGIF